MIKSVNSINNGAVLARGATKAAASKASPLLERWYGPARDKFLLDYTAPDYLDGTMPGDHGYDPLGIGADPKLLEQYRAGEVMNGRFAMLGAVGMIMPEIVKANGVDIKGENWLNGSALMLNGGTLDYYAAPWGVIHNPLTLQGVLVLNGLLVFGAEFFRLSGKFPDGSGPETGDKLYPGFDPLGLSDDPEKFELYKVNEVRNGRLAMMGFLGFVVQGAVTNGEGPYANLTKHIEDPGYNIITNVFQN